MTIWLGVSTIDFRIVVVVVVFWKCHNKWPKFHALHNPWTTILTLIFLLLLLALLLLFLPILPFNANDVVGFEMVSNDACANVRTCIWNVSFKIWNNGLLSFPEYLILYRNLVVFSTSHSTFYPIFWFVDSFIDRSDPSINLLIWYSSISRKKEHTIFISFDVSNACCTFLHRCTDREQKHSSAFSKK